MKFEKELEIVRQKIQKELITGDRYLNGSLDYVTATNGKMIRPTFLLIGATFGKKKKSRKNKNILDMAAAIEALHLATLVHDDIIDEAKLRRGQESVQSKYSKEYALYMGDFILIRCFMMLGSLDIKKDLAMMLAKAVNQICIGEMKQHKYRYSTDVTPMKYLHVVSRKTAALFSISLSAGAKYLEADDEISKKLARIGYEIGMTFQLVDDILDYKGNVALVGKELKADIMQGYYNIPVLFALESKDEKVKILKSMLEGILTQTELRKVHELVIELGGIDKTEDLAWRYTIRALALIEELPDGEGKSYLLDIVPKLVERMK
jgi:heptaprenyl diphosphate synthase